MQAYEAHGHLCVALNSDYYASLSEAFDHIGQADFFGSNFYGIPEHDAA